MSLSVLRFTGMDRLLTQTVQRIIKYQAEQVRILKAYGTQRFRHGMETGQMRRVVVIGNKVLPFIIDPEINSDSST